MQQHHLLFLFCVISVHCTKLVFKACTSDKYQLLLCIDSCEASNTDSYYSTKEVMLDYRTNQLSLVEDTEPIVCPNLDKEITIQPIPKIHSVVVENLTLVWNFTYDNFFNGLVLSPINITKNQLWYDCFFMATKDRKRVFFAIEGSNHEYRHSVAINTETNMEWEWNLTIPHGEPLLNKFGISTVVCNLEVDTYSCEIHDESTNTYYPMLIEPVSLVAFPEVAYVWFVVNDSGLYPFAPNGFVDTRLQSVIEIKDLTVTIYSYSNFIVQTIDLTSQIESLRTGPEGVEVKPSLIVFCVIFLLVIILGALEICTQKNNAATTISTTTPDVDNIS
eukprot:TRINITY_DN6016_c0_g1_i2.p1 TRINITY_DN6016_c0_g1~~TRINITY_DN6016_c0_g1_i2.p1  ORF type:complete len:333 (-),score=1.24 TRINITY_DN6016_c0_g1_i2:211-1209(-)